MAETIEVRTHPGGGVRAIEVGIASGRPGRWHGRVQITRDHADRADLVVVEDERCPHEHRTRQSAKGCADKAFTRIVANDGQWLDPENARRFRKTRRRSAS